MNSNKRVLLIVGATLLVVALLFGLSIAIGGGDDDDTATTDAPSSDEDEATGDTTGGDTTGGDATDGDATGDIEPNRPVEVTGEVLVPYDDSGDDPAVGTAAPVVVGASFDGEPVTIGEATGDHQMYLFLAHWCPHCNAEIPELLTVDDEGGIPDDLRVVGVSTGVDPSAPNYPPSQWLDDLGWRWETLADSVEAEALYSYGASSFPFAVIVDGDGNVVARKAGSSSAADITEWIAANTN